MQNAPEEKKYSIGEASEFLGVSVDTLRRWERAGKISTLRSPGGHRYFLKSDLEGAFGQRYSRATPVNEEVSKSTQLPKDETPLPFQPISTVVDQPTATPEPADYQPPPLELPIESPTSLQEEKVKTPPVFESTDSPLPQTQEKRYTVEEITPATPTQDLNKNQELFSKAPEAYTPDIPDLATVSMPQPEPIIPAQKFDEPLSSFDTPISPPQSKIQPSQTEVTEVTVIPQEKKGADALKKVSLFLLIVFIMVNIILIGFYVFVSNQL